MGWVHSQDRFEPLRGLVALSLHVLVALVAIAQLHPYDAVFATTGNDRQEVRGETQDVAAFSSPACSVNAKKLFPHMAVIVCLPMAELPSSGHPSDEERRSIAWLLGATAAPRAPPSLTL